MIRFPQVAKEAEYQSKLGMTFGNLGRLAAREDSAEAAALLQRAIECQQQARDLDPNNPAYLQRSVDHTKNLVRLLLAHGDGPGAARWAERALPPPLGDDWRNWFYAAVHLGWWINNAQHNANFDEESRSKAIEEYSRRAVDLLQVAFAHGMNDARMLETTDALEPLRDRSDFRELLARMQSSNGSR
jgi:hypothetical protein